MDHVVTNTSAIVDRCHIKGKQRDLKVNFWPIAGIRQLATDQLNPF